MQTGSRRRRAPARFRYAARDDASADGRRNESWGRLLNLGDETAADESFRRTLRRLEDSHLSDSVPEH